MEEVLRRGLSDIKPYEPGRPIELVERELGISEAIKLASNESPYPPFEKVIEAMKAELTRLNRYPDGGATFLREAIAEKHGMKPEQVMVGNGSNELLRLVADALLNPEDEAVMAHPSFIVYPLVLQLLQAKAVMVPLKDYTHDLEAMADAVNEKTKIVFLCNPNNPTGTIVKRDEVETFLSKIPERVAVIFDEAYFELVQDKDYPNGLDYVNSSRLVIVMRTFSKVHGLAGLRVGYGIAPEFIVGAVNKIREPFNVNSVAQVAALASLNCDAEIAQRKETNAEGLRYLYENFERLGLTYVPSQANFVLVDIGMNSREAMNALMREGIIVRPADIFGSPVHIRLTVGTPSENQRFIEVLEKLLSANRKES